MTFHPKNQAPIVLARAAAATRPHDGTTHNWHGGGGVGGGDDDNDNDDDDAWIVSKAKLRDPDCCVVSVIPHDGRRRQQPGQQQSSSIRLLRLLQRQLAGDRGPTDVDLRARIRRQSAYDDCWQVLSTILASESSPSSSSPDVADRRACAMALQELARGMALLAEGSLVTQQEGDGGGGTDVFVRIVCASDYRARDPPFHTDKAPMRGYVTMRGPGTDYMTRNCQPWEYLLLRTLGGGGGGVLEGLQRAAELEFIVMKGDHYYDYYNAANTTTVGQDLLQKMWTRATACVHRSPPCHGGGRRVIISFDLDDGKDDREWYQAGTKRKWRNGLTQRKSRLVA